MEAFSISLTIKVMSRNLVVIPVIKCAVSNSRRLRATQPCLKVAVLAQCHADLIPMQNDTSINQTRPLQCRAKQDRSCR